MCGRSAKITKKKIKTGSKYFSLSFIHSCSSCSHLLFYDYLVYVQHDINFSFRKHDFYGINFVDKNFILKFMREKKKRFPASGRKSIKFFYYPAVSVSRIQLKWKHTHTHTENIPNTLSESEV